MYKGDLKDNFVIKIVDLGSSRPRNIQYIEDNLIE